MTDVARLPHPDPAAQLDREHIPAARLVLSQPEIDDDKDAWLDERRRDQDTGQWRVTASELAVVLGLAPDSHGSPFSLYYDKTEGITTFEGNERTELGLYLEGLVSRRFAAANPDLELGPGGLYVSNAHPWLAATFDRIAYDVRFDCDGQCAGAGHQPGCRQDVAETYQPAGPVQIKSWAQRADFGEAGSGVMPVYLRVQLLVEMAVLGTDIGWLPVIFLPSGKVVTFVIERDEAADRDIDAILQAGAEFVRCLEREEVPEVDWRPSTAETLKHLYPDISPDQRVRVPYRLGFRMHRARRAQAAAERRVKQAQNEIRLLAGHAGQVTCWDPAMKRERVLVTRSAGPRAGYSVPPSDRVEAMRPGPWGSAKLTRAERDGEK
jgi:hypothetical protein